MTTHPRQRGPPEQAQSSLSECGAQAVSGVHPAWTWPRHPQHLHSQSLWRSRQDGPAALSEPDATQVLATQLQTTGREGPTELGPPAPQSSLRTTITATWFPVPGAKPASSRGSPYTCRQAMAHPPSCVVLGAALGHGWAGGGGDQDMVGGGGENKGQFFDPQKVA